MREEYNILIYGTGVIGSVYAVKLSNAGHNVTVYSRGNRLQELKLQGLLYDDNGTVKKALVNIAEKVLPDDVYDYIFVTVRYEQIETALGELTQNSSMSIVTMVNNPNGYSAWEKLLGKGRLIPAFAGAGGKIENAVLHYLLTPKIIQPTTFGEINGEKTERIKKLANAFKTSKVPNSISKNMDAWQKSHLAMVIPLANGVYLDGGNNYTTAKNKKAVRFMSRALRTNFNALKRIGIPVTPQKLNIFRTCPLWIMDFALKIIYRTKFAAKLISAHANAAKSEMILLEKNFNEVIK